MKIGELAKTADVTASAYYNNNRYYISHNVIDGITTSKTHDSGYWILPDSQTGWIQLEWGPQSK